MFRLYSNRALTFPYTLWLGLLTRSGTPDAVIGKLSEAVKLALADPDVIRRLRSEGSHPTFVPAKEFNAELIEIYRDMGEIATQLNLPKQ